MLDSIIANLHNVPLWAWVTVPALVLGIITHICTKGNLRITLAVLGIVLFAGWGATGFYQWEIYLHQHFIGKYDPYGIPHSFSGSGWSLFVSAWPLWFVPSLIVATLVITSGWYLKRYLIRRKLKNLVPRKKHANKATFSTAHQVALKLEIEKLKKELSTAQKMLGEEEEEFDDEESDFSADDNSSRNNSNGPSKAALNKKKQEVKTLTAELDETKNELEKAKILVERLLAEKLEEL